MAAAISGPTRMPAPSMIPATLFAEASSSGVSDSAGRRADWVGRTMTRGAPPTAATPYTTTLGQSASIATAVAARPMP
jgi:hypothetical protein